jgi:Uma2 family endonuclease
MSKRQQSQGCQPMLRRTFLFLIGIALARVEAYIYRNPAPGGYESEIVVADNAVIRMLAFPEIEISFSELFLPV